MKFRCTAMFAGHVVSVAILLLTVCAVCPAWTGAVYRWPGVGKRFRPSGAAVAGATVLVTDVNRGTSRTLTTDEAGAYVAADLTPGTYKIHVEAKALNLWSGQAFLSKWPVTSGLIFHCSRAKFPRPS